jgi:hypothetical protein
LPAHPKGVRGNNLRRVVGAFIFPPALRGNLPSFEECIKHPSRFINGNGLTRLANAPVNGVSDPLMMFLFDRPEHFIRADAQFPAPKRSYASLPFSITLLSGNIER